MNAPLSSLARVDSGIVQVKFKDRFRHSVETGARIGRAVFDQIAATQLTPLP
jgi:ABC-type phosphonate transport system ATPase subunit